MVCRCLPDRHVLPSARIRARPFDGRTDRSLRRCRTHRRPAHARRHPQRPAGPRTKLPSRPAPRLVFPALVDAIARPDGLSLAEDDLQLFLLLAVRHGARRQPGAGAVHGRSPSKNHHYGLNRHQQVFVSIVNDKSTFIKVVDFGRCMDKISTAIVK